MRMRHWRPPRTRHNWPHSEAMRVRAKHSHYITASAAMLVGGVPFHNGMVTFRSRSASEFVYERQVSPSVEYLFKVSGLQSESVSIEHTLRQPQRFFRPNVFKQNFGIDEVCNTW